MSKTMKAAVMVDVNKICFETRPIPKPKADEALIKLEYVGICGSDMHFYQEGRIGNVVVKPPFVLGHEAGGVVAAIGTDVTHLKPGDRVALEPGKTCKICEFCRTGKYNLCPEVIFFSTPPFDGVFQEYTAHEAALCFKLPDHVSTLEGALIEPFAVGLYAASQGGARIGKTAAVFGCGCIGLVSIMALLAQGVTTIYAVDGIAKRLEKALEVGATGVVNYKNEDPVEAINVLTGNRGCDLIIETSGAEIAVNQAIKIGRKGASIMLVGFSVTDTINWAMNEAIDKELRFGTIFRYRHNYPTAISAAGGKVNLKSIVTHTFSFDDIPQAMARYATEKDDIVKAIIQF